MPLSGTSVESVTLGKVSVYGNRSNWTLSELNCTVYSCKTSLNTTKSYNFQKYIQTVHYELYNVRRHDVWQRQTTEQTSYSDQDVTASVSQELFGAGLRPQPLMFFNILRFTESRLLNVNEVNFTLQ